jgi:hypothetical protein
MEDTGKALNQVDRHVRVPLLLHSMAEFRHMFFDAFAVADVKTVVEIGAEEGILTEELIEWATRNQGAVWAIDPAPSPRLRDLADRHEEFDLVVAHSLEALPTLPQADCYLIDGDHNYYTVSEELRAIVGERVEPNRLPLVFLHDVRWPSGRRDQYYSPNDIPEAARQPFRYDRGVVPGNPDLVQGGFRGNGEFAVATREGGPHNGVLTAVEDFLDDHPELELHIVPSVFGLGVLLPRSASYAGRIRDLLSPYEENPLLQRLEANRLALYVKVLELQDVLDERASIERDLRKQLEEIDLRVRDTAVENRALWVRQRELEEQKKRLRIKLAEILSSRSFRLIDSLSRAGKFIGRDLGVSRSQLQEIVDDKG